MNFWTSNFNNNETEVKLKKNEITLRLEWLDSSLDVLYPDQTSKGFDSLFASFHSPSEHTVNGEHYPLEMNFVHNSQDWTTWSIINVFFEVGEEENEFIDSLDFENATEEGNILSNFDMEQFFEKIDKSKYW